MEAYSPHHVALGRAIRRLRRERGLSQEGLAAKCDVDRSFMGVIERGQRNFSFAKLIQICAGLELPASQLLAECERELAEDPELEG